MSVSLMAKFSRCIELGGNGQELPDVLNLTGHADTNLYCLHVKVNIGSLICILLQDSSKFV